MMELCKQLAKTCSGGGSKTKTKTGGFTNLDKPAGAMLLSDDYERYKAELTPPLYKCDSCKDKKMCIHNKAGQCILVTWPMHRLWITGLVRPFLLSFSLTN
jgi:hypothetical protein